MHLENLQQLQGLYAAHAALQEAQLQRQTIARSAIGFAETLWPKNKQPLKGFHREWLELADSGQTFVLLAARDHFKTAVITQLYSLYRIVKDPNTQGLLVSESATQSHKWSRWLRRSIEQRFPWLDGSHLVNGKWTDRIFTVPREREESKDGTIEAVGMFGRITGGHFGWAIVDDVVGQENSRSKVMREHVSDWFHETLIPLMEPDSQIIIPGSPWAWGDLYMELETEGWKVYKYKAFTDKELTIPLFPERYTLDTLAKKQRDMGTPFFNCQFMLDPSGLVGKVFKLEWLEPYYDPPVPGDLELVAGIDLAFSEKTTADYTAIATVGYSATSNTMYLVNMERFHADFPTQLDRIVQHWQQWQESKIMIEKNAMQNLLVVQPLLKTTMLPLVPIENVRDKVARIQAIGPYFENKKLVVRRDQAEFISEYLQFEPNCDHDDMLDALEMAVKDIVQRHMLTSGYRGSGAVFGRPKDSNAVPKKRGLDEGPWWMGKQKLPR